jgi:hypothetical protein
MSEGYIRRGHLPASKTDIHKTPKDLLDRLYAEFDFNFDPCPVDADFDGLKVDWNTRTYINPPFSDLSSWIEKGYEESKKGNLCVFLIKNASDTKAFHKYIMQAREIRMIEGRLNYNDADKPAPFPSIIVVFHPHGFYPFLNMPAIRSYPAKCPCTHYKECDGKCF